MSKAALFVTDGFEETEAVAPLDILRRGGVEIQLVSLTGRQEVRGKHGITVKADILFDAIKENVFDMLIIPGGTVDYLNYPLLIEIVKKHFGLGKFVAAICAAPAVFGKAGILKGRRAVIYPGMADYLGTDAVFADEDIVEDGNIITAKGPGISMRFGIKLLEVLKGKEASAKVSKDFILSR